MIEELGIAEPAEVGYYSGRVESVYSFAQLFTVGPIIPMAYCFFTDRFCFFLECRPVESISRRITGHPYQTVLGVNQ